MRLVVCGCVKNGESYIEDHLLRLFDLRKIFDHVHFLLFENDSKDRTLDILSRLDVEVLSFKNLSGSRQSILSFGRNKLIEHIHKFHNESDLILMTDLDHVLSRFDYTIIESVMKNYNIDDWDVLTANNYQEYYDIYALRTNQNRIWNEPILFDCWREIEKERAQQRDEYALRCKYVKRYQKNIPKSGDLIPVISAFGGMAIYKLNITKGCEYSIRHGCEHVQFHLDILNHHQGRIFICPMLLTSAEDLHIVK